MLKKHHIMIGIVVLVLVCTAIHYLRMPNITIVYDYNGNAYTQNTRSPFRQKITLEGYTDITFVTPNDNGYYCHAKSENGNGCFLSVVNDKVAIEIPEDYSETTVYGAMIYNDMFLIDYSYDISRINQSTSYLLIDFSTGEKHYYDQVKIDYFAVSLPDLQLFDEDLTVRNRAHCEYLIALGSFGLGQTERSKTCYDRVLAIDNTHQGAILHKRLLERG